MKSVSMLSTPLSRIVWLLTSLLSALSTTQHISFASAAPATLSVVDTRTTSYNAEVVEWLNDLDYNLVYAASLMLPPGDAQLCEFPTEDQLGNYTAYRTPVALMVNAGGCTAVDKAKVALEIQDKITNSLRYIVLYNDDVSELQLIPQVNGPSSKREQEPFQVMGMVSVSTATGSKILNDMQDLSDMLGTSPILTDPNSKNWQMPAIIDREDRRQDFRSYSGSGSRSPSSFYWFRLVLFALLITSPCCRAGYLWWSAGGRIRFRRNENGRINGLEYVQPVQYWFASNMLQGDGQNGGNNNNNDASRYRMTPEQVMALPEIVYKESSAGGGDAQHENDITVSGTSTTLQSSNTDTQPSTQSEDNFDHNDGEMEDVDIVVGSGSADGPELPSSNDVSPTATSLSAVEEQRQEVAPEGTTEHQEEYITSCTTCSICIDDFEENERIRYLPRCKHAFHTDCILPWLCERRGCCPLCKKPVLEEFEEENSSVREENNEPAGESQEEQGAGGPENVTFVLGPIDLGESDQTIPASPPSHALETSEPEIILESTEGQDMAADVPTPQERSTIDSR